MSNNQNTYGFPYLESFTKLENPPLAKRGDYIPVRP